MAACVQRPFKCGEVWFSFCFIEYENIRTLISNDLQMDYLKEWVQMFEIIKYSLDESITGQCIQAKVKLRESILAKSALWSF